ncbi:MOB kinase activator 3A isoform X2 [Hydra vulgaris]|uniref:MOB kinase activator 3A isoform X2 n=1 Tax=Hydra vulgaris TaxID=6087 RepID=UPI001F5EDC3E|nr:MOB kinase activator 3A-like isoform X2 [Hydra vulgaris]
MPTNVTKFYQMADKKGGFFKIGSSNNRQKTFRPKKKWESNSIKYQLHKKARATLKSGIDMREAVALPPSEDLDDWLAVHVVDFYNRINLIYGTISDVCTEASCPVMSGGPKYEYYWADGEKYKKPTALSAPMYISTLMDWVDHQVNDENIFPPNSDDPFPKNFLSIVKNILKRLFRVFVHVYIHHFEKIVSLGAEAHINQCYKHFYHFVTEFDLIEKRELNPLKDMTMQLCG